MKNTTCNICGAVFSSTSSRNRHAKNIHPGINNSNDQIHKIENDQKIDDKPEEATPYSEKSTGFGTNGSSETTIGSTISCEICGQEYKDSKIQHLYQNHFKQQIKDDYGNLFLQSAPNCPSEGCSFKNEQRPDLLKHFLVSHNILSKYEEKAMADKNDSNHEKCSQNPLDALENNINDNVDKKIKVENQLTNSATLEKHALENNINDNVDKKIKVVTLKKHVCTHCAKAFGRKEHLKRHVKNLHGVRDHKCDNCGKRFKTDQYLKVHERIHTGDKPYQCKFCDFKFAQKSQLLQHERIHTGKKPYRCTYCTEQFTQKSQVQQHEKHRHTGT